MARHPELRISVTDGTERTIALRGELDLATAPALRQTLLDTLASVDGQPVVLDASGLTFVDSSGLSVLLMGARRFGAAGKRLVLRAPSTPLARVIELTGAGAAFEVEE